MGVSTSRIYEAKTKSANISVEDYLSAIKDEERRKDCEAVDKLLRRITSCAPIVWSNFMVGYGYHYRRYDSGHEGVGSMIGFASRQTYISLYIVPGFSEMQGLLKDLGPHKAGSVSLYIKRLADIDESTLEKIVVQSVEATKRHYPCELT
jgi:hypothetical protein